MTSEFLLDAIGQMDDELVTQAAAPTRRAIPWLKVSGLAAAVVLCVGVASLPGLLSMNGAASGMTTAPESDFILGDALLDYEYRSEQESQVKDSSTNKSESTVADGSAPTQGVFAPLFFTQRGVYFLIGEEFPYKPKLPDTEVLKGLGVLVASVPGEQVYPSTGTQEYVGCPVWESADGKTLYIQLKDGDCLFATLYE
ncbi:MAG: hypothetical protein E7440_04985 [Ruminococcaceae bacterium]|nr:hypothetical protein [Oscillospiraceae bacterium]